MRISLCVFVCNLNRIGDETKGGWVEEVGRARHVFGEIPLRTPLRVSVSVNGLLGTVTNV
uniref:Uncharacterized protein n=1 Tax=Oryza glumipatula TaxID=40148 RepID=A0A0E0B6D1_9ORYZ